MTQNITRRQAIKTGSMAIPALAVATASGYAKPTKVAQVTPVQLPSRSIVEHNDMTVAIRNWFPNRCPLLCRFPWIPCERTDFLTFSHRYEGGLFTVGTAATQYCQEFHFPESRSPSPWKPVLPGGAQSSFYFNMTMQLQNMVDDIELSMLYEVPTAPIKHPATGQYGSAKMGGLRSIIKTNNVQEPRNNGRYGPDDLVRDTVDRVRQWGGKTDVILISSDIAGQFACRNKWGDVSFRAVKLFDTVFGTPVNAIESNLMPGVTIIEAPLMHLGSAAALQSSEVYGRTKIVPHWNPGSGDKNAGALHAEMSIEIINEHHFAWVSGITGFAKS